LGVGTRVESERKAGRYLDRLGAVNHNNAAESQTNLLEGSERDPFSLIFIYIILFFSY